MKHNSKQQTRFWVWTAIILTAVSLLFTGCISDAKMDITLTIKAGANVKSVTPQTIVVTKGSKWGDVKGKITVSYKDGYETAGWKLGNETGKDITDETVFNENTAIFAVSKAKSDSAKITLTIKAGANVKSVTPQTLVVTKGSKWSDVKGKITVSYKDGYETAGWKLGSETGKDITDGTVFESDTTVVAVSKTINITLTIKAGANVQSVTPETLVVTKGSKWSEVKGKISAQYEEHYESAGWKLGSETGNDITDETVFDSDTTVVAVSKTINITLTIKAGANVKNVTPQTHVIIEGSKWSEVKGKISAQYEEHYESAGWKLGSETGNDITDETVFGSDTKVVAVSKLKKGFAKITVDSLHKTIKVKVKTSDNSNVDVYGCNTPTTIAGNNTEHTITATGTDIFFENEKISELDFFAGGNNHIIYLDVNGLLELKLLDCSENKLTALDVKDLPILKELNCNNNQELASIVLNNLPKLWTLWCQDCKLSNLDLKGLSALQTLRCDGNKLTSLDVKDLEALNHLTCSLNMLNADAFKKIFEDLPTRESSDDATFIIFSKRLGDDDNNHQNFTAPEDLKNAFEKAKTEKHWNMKKYGSTGAQESI